MPPFFSFDGIDGVGKSTQLHLFCEWLTGRGLEVVVCRDPGSTSIGERIRQLLLESDDSTEISLRCEMLLYMAARAQLVDEVIRPALAAGKTVVSDRYLLANIAYQGHSGGLGAEAVRKVGAVAIDGVMPDLTFLLDMDPATALKRVSRPLDRIETRGQEYRERLRDGFLAEAAALGDAVRVIDADGDVQAVQQRIRAHAAVILPPEAS